MMVANWQILVAIWQHRGPPQGPSWGRAVFASSQAREVTHEVTITRVRTALDHAARSEPLPPGAGPAYPVAGLVTLQECRDGSPVFTALLVDAAGRAGLDQRDLRVRVLLQLPRVASTAGRVTASQIERELQRCGEQLTKDVAASRASVPRDKFGLGELVVTDRADSVAAGQIFAFLHYLRNDRPGARYFALLDPAQGLPVTICAVAPLEWPRIGRWIRQQFDVPPDRVRDVARVYSCPTAPPNAVSFLLAKVRQQLAREKAADLLMTAVDPNLGFTGASYRAANWQRWFAIQPRPYLYSDGQYVSPRQLRQRFGTSSLAELRVRYPRRRFEQSRTRLLDSLIFGCPVGREMNPRDPLPTQPLHR